jgi:hypothetical protein
MTSKERVLCAFNGTNADRVPFDYSGNAGINQKLAAHFNTDYYGVLDALDIDFRVVGAPYAGKELFPEKKDRKVDPVYGFYMKWCGHATGGYWDFCDFPLQNADTETVARFPVPDPNDFDYDRVAYEAGTRFKERAVFCGGAGMADIINATGRVMGMEDTLVNLASGEEGTAIYLKRRCAMELNVLEKIIRRAKGGIDFLWWGEDLGTQIGPMISPDLYRAALKPFHKQYCELAKSYNLPVMVHSCGSSSWAYGDFIEMGVNAVDTLQPEAADMSPEYLAGKFGGKLAFHGCISTAGPLAYGTARDVEDEVKRVLQIMMPYKKYMLSPTHSIQDNSPLENVLSLYAAGLKYGKY